MQLIQNTASASLSQTPKATSTKLQATILCHTSVFDNLTTGSTVSVRTVAASHDVTMVVVGTVVGLILILLLLALYAFLRRRGLSQVATGKKQQKLKPNDPLL